MSDLTGWGRDGGNVRSAHSRVCAAVVAVAALLGWGLANPAGAATDPTGAVSLAQTSHGDFDEAGVHAEAMRALAGERVFDGTECESGGLCPNEALPRWVMAVWLARVLDGEEPPAPDSSRFEDVEADEWWSAHVERLADLEVTLGCASDEAPLFCPDDIVTRGQMASLLVRAFDLEEPDGPAGFGDTERSGHGGSIEALHAAGITVGCHTDPLLYCPRNPVTRAQMASFLHRAMQYEQGSDDSTGGGGGGGGTGGGGGGGGGGGSGTGGSGTVGCNTGAATP